MKPHQLGMTGLLLACAGLLAAPAAAQVRSDVTASNLRFVLIDLTPDDGETPWFNFTQADLSPFSASTSVTPLAGSEQRARDGGERRGHFEFSPNTRLSLALDIDIDMRAVPLAGAEQSGTVWAAFLAKATWGPPKDRWERRDSEDVYGDVGLYFGDFRNKFDRNETFWLNMENDTDYAASGEFAIFLESSSYALASPVPEASTPAMFALGVGMLGFLGRRRARARAQR
jgi:hypothetical protein